MTMKMSGWKDFGGNFGINFGKKFFLSVLFVLLTLACAEAAGQPGEYWNGAGAGYYGEPPRDAAPYYGAPQGGYYQETPPPPQGGYYAPAPGGYYPEPAPAPRPAPKPKQNVKMKPTGNARNYQPTLTGFEFSQVGDTDLVMRIAGSHLPAPEVRHFDNKTMIVFREVYGGNVSSEHRANEAPMIMAVRTEQVDMDVRITVTTDLPLQILSTRGAPPANFYTLELTTAQHYANQINEVDAIHQPQTPRIPTGPFAASTPITLDVREADLRDVLRMIAEHVKKNVVIDASLPFQTVTMTVKNEPLNAVFDYLMKAYGVTYEMMGNTVLFGTREGLGKISGKLETRKFQIAYATPTSVASLLPNLTPNVPASSYVVDERLRTIYATASPVDLEEVAIAIQNLDHPGKQVRLEARILEFSESATLDVQSAINAVYDHFWTNISNGQGAGGFIDDNRLGRAATPTSPIQPSGGLATPMQGIWREFDIAFNAMERTEKTKVLASPSVITIDGQRADVSLTEDYPYISGRDDGGNAQWSLMTVGPKLGITPRVGRDGYVTIDLDISTGDIIGVTIGSLGEEMPRASTRSVRNVVRIRHGEPFVVGGLFREEDRTTVTRIPILGQIPIIGDIFFSYRNKSHPRTQVVIIVVPYILNTPDIGILQERVMMRQ